MSDFDHLSERQQIALTFLALVERKRIHQVRREALAAYAEQALADPHIQTAVTACLSYRRRQRSPLRLVATQEDGATE